MVKVVTDSTADLPPSLIAELGVTIVPVYVIYGKDSYRDRIDISEDELYERLLKDPVHPTTTQPTPHDFTEVYRNLSKDTDGIISIHLTSKLSGTYNSAVQGAKEIQGVCPVEVIDTQSLSMGFGLMVIEAARMSKAGATLEEIVKRVNEMILNTHLLVLFDTLKYLHKGGRIGKAKALLGSILNVKPLLTVREGEFVPSSQVRSRNRGIESLWNLIQGATNIKALAVVHSTTLDEAKLLAERAASIIPKENIYVSRLGPALGVHGGPGVLGVMFNQ